MNARQLLTLILICSLPTHSVADQPQHKERITKKCPGVDCPGRKDGAGANAADKKADAKGPKDADANAPKEAGRKGEKGGATRKGESPK